MEIPVRLERLVFEVLPDCPVPSVSKVQLEEPDLTVLPTICSPALEVGFSTSLFDS